MDTSTQTLDYVMLISSDTNWLAQMTDLLESVSIDPAPVKITIETVTDMHHAHQRLSDQPPHLIVLDATSSQWDSLSVCRQLKAATNKSTPLLLLLPDANMIDEALNAGADDCLVAPIHARLLRRRIKHWLKTQMLQRDVDRSQQRYWDIFDQIPVMLHMIDADGVMLHINQAWQQTVGYTRDQIIGKRIDKFLDEDSKRRALTETLPRLMRDGAIQDVWYRAYRPDGTLLDLELNSRLVQLPDETTVGLTVLRDTSEQRRIERELRESEQRYRHLFEYANDAILLVDALTGKIMDANRQTTQLLGYSYDELMRMSIERIDTATDDISTSELQQLDLSHKGQFIAEQAFRHKEGHIIPVETSSRVMHYDGRAAILTFARDITARQQARRAEYEQRLIAETLRDSAAAFNRSITLEEVLDVIMDYVPRLVTCDGVTIMLVDDGNAHIRRHHGYTQAGFSIPEIESIAFDVAKTPNLKWIYENKQPLIIGDTSQTTFKWQPSITSEWILSYMGVPIINHDTVIGFINLDSNRLNRFEQRHADRLWSFASQAAIAIDNAQLFESIQRRVEDSTAELVKSNMALRRQVYERKQVEDALEAERNLLQTLIDNLPDHIYVKDTKSRFLLANPATVRILNHTAFDDIAMLTDFDLMPVAEAQANFDAEQHLMKTGIPIMNQEIQMKAPDGSLVWLLVNKVALRDNEGQITGLIGINHDVTSLKQAEEKLQEDRNLLRTLVDTIPDLIYIKDLKSRFVLANRNMIYALGAHLMSDVVAKTERDFFDDAQAERYIAQDEQVLRTGSPIINHAEQFTDAIGQTYWHLISKMPLYDARGKINGLIGVHRNITDVRQAEEQLRQVLTSARCLLWSAQAWFEGDDIQWDSTITSEEAAQAFLPLDTSEQDYITAWQHSILPEDWQRRQYTTAVHLRYGQPTFNHEIRCQQDDGSVRWLHEAIKFEKQGDNLWRLVGVCTDITERKQAELELVQAYDDLDNLVAERTSELSEANAILKQEVAERKRAVDAERNQRILAEALRDSAAALNSTLDLYEMLDHLLDAVNVVVPYDAANVMLIEGEYMVEVRQRGYGDIDSATRPLVDWPEMQQIIESKKPYIIHDTHTYQGWSGLPEFDWVRSNISVPVLLDDIVIGFISLDSAIPHYFTIEHAERLQAFANQAGVAIRNAQLVEEIQRHSAELEAHVRERTAELQHERAQLAAILNSMRDGVVYQDMDGQPQYINNAMTELTGYSLDEWMAEAAIDGLNTEPREARDELWRTVNNALDTIGYWQGETILRQKNGDMFDVRLTRTAVRDMDDKRVGMVTVLRDISQAKRLEAQKTRFIASASHELRTPIANIMTRLYLMRRRPEKFQDHIDIAESVARWMKKLVEDMFDLSRFEQGLNKLERETIVLQQLLKQSAEFQMPHAHESNIDLTLNLPDTPMRAWVDYDRLMQVIVNLLNNAIKYTPPGGKVTVHLETDYDDDSGDSVVIIGVQDTGLGVSPDILPQLFDPFFQVTDDQRGAGLGLTIAREIVELHGGRISATSEPGKGSRFDITLPLKAITPR